MNKQLILFLVILCLMGFQVQSQCRINYVNPYHLLREFDSLKTEHKYDQIINLLHQKHSQDSIIDVCYYHQLACFYSLKRDTNEAFKNLYTAIAHYDQPEDILSDTDLEPLYPTQQWHILQDTLNKIYLERLPDITKKELSIQLWRFWIEDQSARTLGANFKKKRSDFNSKEWSNFQKEYRKQIEQKQKEAWQIIKNNGWPLYSEVGQLAGDAIGLVAMHGYSSFQKKVAPYMKLAVEKGEASGHNYAVTLDRYLKSNDKKQVYGTAVSKHLFKGATQMSDWILWPIEDEINVDKRREAIGLAPLKEYLKAFGINYEYKPENENRKLPFRNTLWGMLFP